MEKLPKNSQYWPEFIPWDDESQTLAIQEDLILETAKYLRCAESVARELITAQFDEIAAWEEKSGRRYPLREMPEIGFCEECEGFFLEHEGACCPVAIPSQIG